jgi:hypothetical protein
MRVRVLERGATSIDEAYTIAVRHETYVAAAGVTSPLNVNRTPSYEVRAVGSTTDCHQPSPFDQRLSALERAVSSLTGELQNLRFAIPPSNGPPNTQPSPPGVPFQQFTPRPERLCYLCQSPDHLRRQCPQRTTSTAKQTWTGNSGASTTSPNGNIGLVTPVSSSEALLPVWIINPVVLILIIFQYFVFSILEHRMLFCLQNIVSRKYCLQTYH